MDPRQAPGVYEGVANVIAAVMLLIEFGLLRQALARDQIRLYMAQSALISVLAIVIAADRNLPELYALAALSAALKVVAVPLVMRRLLGRTDPIEGEEAPGVAGSQTLSPASAVLAGIVLAAIGFFCFGALKIHGPAAPALALALAAAMVLVSFGLMIVRRDVASQAIGFFTLENAISLAALVVASGLPLILETAFLFDLLVAVVVFGMLIRATHGRSESLSTADLTKLRGLPVIGVILALLIVPLAAAVACATLPGPAARRLAPAITVTAGIASFGLVLALLPSVAHRDLNYLSYLRVDALSEIFLLATAFLYAVVASYTVGYAERQGHHPQYARRLYAGLNLFAWAMLAAPLMSSLALLWIAVEITTIVSALLVAIEAQPGEAGDGAAEAAWKYVLIASAGLGLALLATVFAYFAGAQVLGEHYDLAIAPLIHVAARLPATPVRLAFLLALLGYGTKVGLFPVHTWLPDAHSEAPTPVSALLSGALLATSFYAILRFYEFTAAALGSDFPRDALLAFGVASLLLAALYVFGQRDIKRLLAYSSIEHMGILAIGVSFGAPVALAGVMLHVLAHAAAKGNAFMGAGVLVVKYRTKQMATMRGALDLLPWSGPLFLLAIFALSALPPSGIFRSEFQIVAGGLGSGHYAAAAVLVVLVTVAFFGLTTSTTRILFTPAPRSLSAAAPIDRGEPSAWMVVPAVAGIAVLFVLGLHPPGELTGLIARAVAQLGAAR
jgi:hydrogenase-4 component F